MSTQFTQDILRKINGKDMAFMSQEVHGHIQGSGLRGSKRELELENSEI